MAEQNKVALEINNNELLTDTNTNLPSPTDGDTLNQKNITTNNESINDDNNNEPITDNNTGVSSPIAGPSGAADNINNNANNEPINDTNGSDSSPAAGTRTIPRKNWIKCDICNVFVSSQKLMQVHLSGKRHNIIARKINECPRNYGCELCKISANSEKQLADHYASKKHKARIEELERIDDIKFYCMYGSIIIILSWIIISYLLYFTFIFAQ